LFALACAPPAFAQPKPDTSAQPADLASFASGTYARDVI